MLNQYTITCYVRICMQRASKTKNFTTGGEQGRALQISQVDESESVWTRSTWSRDHDLHRMRLAMNFHVTCNFFLVFVFFFFDWWDCVCSMVFTCGSPALLLYHCMCMCLELRVMQIDWVVQLTTWWGWVRMLNGNDESECAMWWVWDRSIHRHGHVPPLSPCMLTYGTCVDGDVSSGIGDDGSRGDDAACACMKMSIGRCVACEHVVETYSYCTSALTALKCDMYTV